jgi:triosephosphate isomerase
MRRPLVAGNWKMHGTRTSVAELLTGLLDACRNCRAEVAVMPSLVHLEQVFQALEGSEVVLGAQNCAVEPGQGALTGEVSASQLLDFSCTYVLVGHSERRQLLGEDDQQVVRKFSAVQSCGITPILCVGETLAERESDQTLNVVLGQVGAVLDALGVQAFSRAVVAYEPVWAIGTGLTATADQAQQVHAAIRQHVAAFDADVAEKLRILYGGSVKSTNAVELFAMPDIDGGLVGGASLNADEFGAICRAAGN